MILICTSIRSYNRNSSCDGDSTPEKVTIHIKNHCLDIAGSNQSVVYNFPVVEWFNGTQCETSLGQRELSSDCSKGGQTWLSYTAPTHSPTTTPTAQPTEQTHPKFTVNAAVGLSGLVAAVLDDNSKAAIVATTCAAMQLPSGGCVFAYVTFQQIGGTFTAIVNVVTTVELVDHPEFEDVDSLFDSVNTLLSDSFTSGQFAQSLSENAVVYSAPALASVGLEEPTLDVPVVQMPPTHSPTQQPTDASEINNNSNSNKESNNLNNGEFAGIVIGAVMFCLLLGIACYAAVSHRNATVTATAEEKVVEMKYKSEAHTANNREQQIISATRNADEQAV